MEQKYGKLVWTNINDFQNSYVKDETESFLEDMGVVHAEKEIQQITDVFMCNGKMRGRIFFSRSFQSSYKGNDPLRLPVYGVKGEHREKSVSNYTHWYISREEELLGADFFNTIFGTCFGTEEEYRTLKKPEEMFQTQQESRMLRVGKNQEFPFIHIMESLWEVLEKDPSARFVIVLPSDEGSRKEIEEKAEEDSLDILWQIYLMMPQRLRLTMGFAICVTPQEMIDLAETKDLPIHLFITNSNSDLTVLNNARFSYHIFQINQYKGYQYGKEKQEMLEKLLNCASGTLLEELLDTSEEVYLQKENKTIGFDAYKEILDPIIVPWYEKDENNNLIKLLQYRELQEPILACGNLEKERRIIFLGEILPQKKYGVELAYHILKHIMNPDEKTDVLEKSRVKLGLGFLIDAMRQLSIGLESFYNREKESLKNEIQELEKKKKYSQEQITKLSAENIEKKELIVQLGNTVKAKNAQIEELSNTNKAKDKQIDELGNVNKAKDKQIDELGNANKVKDKQIDELANINKAKGEQIIDLSNTNKAKDKQIDELGNANKAKDKQIDELSNAVRAKDEEIVNLSKKIEELEKEKWGLKEKNDALEKELAKKEELAEYIRKTNKLERDLELQNNTIQKFDNILRRMSEKLDELENVESKSRQKKGGIKGIKKLFSKEQEESLEEENKEM